jgi:Spy/CpxP family protein refolding chaperone
MEDQAPQPSHARRRRGHGRIAVALVLGLSLVAAAAWAGLRAQGGFGHRGAFMARHSPQLVHDFIEFRIDRALNAVGATDEQKRQIQSILARTFEEHVGHFEEHAALREQAAALLSAETIDEAQIEALRAAQIQRIDAASRKLVATLVEISELLTPEQRRRLMELQHSRFE